MSFHTKRSPSQAKRFLSCPGALALCDSLPEDQKNQSSDAARLGTATHGLIERCLKEGSHPEDYRDRIIELIGDEESVSILRANAKMPEAGRVFFIVDSDIIDGAELMTTYVRQRCKELGVDESALQLETRTNPLPDRDDTSGTADVTIDGWPEILEVVDYKNGYNVVEHEDNEQLLAYLLGKALEAEFAHETYRVTVVQPNAGHEDGRVRSFTVTKKELLEFQARYRKGIDRCEVAEESFEKLPHGKTVNEVWAGNFLKAGDHCLFCDAQAVCPARAKLAQAHAKMDFAEEPEEFQFTQREADVARILEWAPQMEALIRAANLYAQRSMESGHHVPGFKLVRGRSTRKWRPELTEKDIVRDLTKGGWIKDKSALFSKPELLSGPQVEQLIPKDRRDVFNEVFLHKPEGSLTVAAERDPRPGVKCSAADDFADADEDDLDFG